MATPNRAKLIERVLKVLRKQFKPAAPPKERSGFEHLVFACLVEDSPYESAEQVFHQLRQEYFGWNEVRVSTIRELTDALKPLVNPAESAARLKQTLHSVFESVYEFDIENFKKQNLGAAIKHLEKYNGTTPFAVAYVTQHALGGHSIPINRGAMITLHTVGVITDDEFKKGIVPGLERAISKNKGGEVGSLLHQLGVEVGKNPYGPAARKLMLEIDPGCKDRLPRKPVPQPVLPPPPPPPPKPTAAELKRAAAAAEAKKKEAAAKQSAAKPAPKKEPLKKPPTKKPAKPAVTKKPARKPEKKATKKGTKRPTSHKLVKRKPR